MQTQHGHWYFVPDQPAQPIRDTRLCRNAGEWCLLIGAIIALPLLIGWFTGSGGDALIGTLVCLGEMALFSLL